jgi:hypothetical protein
LVFLFLCDSRLREAELLAYPRRAAETNLFAAVFACFAAGSAPGELYGLLAVLRTKLAKCLTFCGKS